MAKIQRFTGWLKAFASAATGTKRTIFGSNLQSDVLDNNITADFLKGWEIVPGNTAPTKQDMNAMGFVLGQLIAYLHQMGIAEWDSAQEYHIGSVVQRSGGVYLSIVNTNVGHDPVGDLGVHWDDRLAKLTEVVLKAGDTMTGALTAPGLKTTATLDIGDATHLGKTANFYPDNGAGGLATGGAVKMQCIGIAFGQTGDSGGAGGSIGTHRGIFKGNAVSLNGAVELELDRAISSDALITLAATSAAPAGGMPSNEQPLVYRANFNSAYAHSLYITGYNNTNGFNFTVSIWEFV